MPYTAIIQPDVCSELTHSTHASDWLIQGRYVPQSPLEIPNQVQDFYTYFHQA